MKSYTLFLTVLLGLSLFSSCDKTPNVGSLDVNFRLTYQDSPLVMFNDYVYPDGRKINFTRFSFYLTDLNVGDNFLNDIAYVDMTDINSNMITASSGIKFSYGDLPAGNQSMLSFGVGLNPTLNATNPSDYKSGHPLAKPAEHWGPWNSYVFAKLEGNMDSDNDGVKDKAFAMHLGSDIAYKLFSSPIDIEIKEDETTQLDIYIDAEKFFKNGTKIYDIDANPQIHSLSQQDAVAELADNMTNAISMAQ